MQVKPFSINIPQDTLDDLHDRLARTRWTDEVEGADWDYGTNLGYLKQLADYWQHSFDWRAQEAMLNGFAQFKTEIDGFGVHFIHERGKGPNPTPLLLLHGWPDSFFRFYKIIPMLTDPARFGGDAANSFDVIVPSLPGFGFSDRPRNRGGADSAGILGKLMTDVLGYSKFGVHGGDTGSPIAQQIGQRFPDAVIGVHLTDIGYDKLPMLDPAELTPTEKAYAEANEQWMFQEGAYIMIQGTKPQTLAYGLNDSPTGLASWIVDKFRAWSDCNGDVESRFSKDELLTDITLYWVTQTINSSMRGYYEGFHADWGGDADGESGESGDWGAAQETPQVPAGVALFPKDHPAPRELAERFMNVQHWTEMPTGGHFAALEEPELLVKDMRTFFQSVR